MQDGGDVSDGEWEEWPAGSFPPVQPRGLSLGDAVVPDQHMSDTEDQDDGGDPSAASARLLFLLDITGSMSEELDACKGAMHGLVSMCADQLQDYSGQLSFAVITFTED